MPSSSSFSGGRKVIYSSSSMVAMLMIILLVLQIWVCCDCQAGAIRIFPTPNETEMKEGNSMVPNNNKSYKKADLVHKYFGGSAFNFNRTEKGLVDDKRRVPSCPDPLHN